MPSRVLIPFAPGFEEMEGIILTDVLRRGGVLVTTASLENGTILASRKTLHLADAMLDNIASQSFDLIVLPGGIEGTKNLMKSDILKDILLRQQQRSGWIGAICAAPNVLRSFGIISGSDPFTAYPTSLELSDGGNYISDRIVTHGQIITSVGPGSAFEFALYLLEKLEGKEVSSKVEKGLYLPNEKI